MTWAFPHTVGLVSRVKSGVDSFGNDVWAEQTVSLPGIFIPGGSVEQVQGQDLLTIQPRVMLPPGTDVSSVDAIDVDGDRYEVDGSPTDWEHPGTGWRPGVEVPLRRVTG